MKMEDNIRKILDLSVESLLNESMLLDNKEDKIRDLKYIVATLKQISELMDKFNDGKLEQSLQEDDIQIIKRFLSKHHGNIESNITE